jgi:hypothetical protein
MNQREEPCKDTCEKRTFELCEVCGYFKKSCIQIARRKAEKRYEEKRKEEEREYNEKWGKWKKLSIFF